jgi:hypothetical protein
MRHNDNTMKLHRLTVRARGLLLLIAVAQIAWAARTELNLARDRSTDAATTALIVTELETGAAYSGLHIWLHGITDLSLPPEQQQQVVLSSIVSARRGHYARVSPGRYLVDVECEARAQRTNSEALTIDAAAGRAYVIGCVARTKDGPPKAYVRETEPEKLQLTK